MHDNKLIRMVKIRMIIIIISILSFSNITYSQNDTAQIDREVWVSTMIKIIDPVFENLSNETLKKSMDKGFDNKAIKFRTEFSCLEAVSRSFCGIAPWLNCKLLETSKESDLQKQFLNKVKFGIANQFDPLSPDYIDFAIGRQCLVEGAYFSLGFLRAYDCIWKKLDVKTQKQIIIELKKTRNYEIPDNNWMLFASMVETFLYKVGEVADMKRLQVGVATFVNKFYVGDGIYSDGDYFSLDYYNSYVIHPMISRILFELQKDFHWCQQLWDLQKKRHARYAEIQERFISPEGTYPVIGRTITCRTGAFHALSQAALIKLIPSGKLGQCRSALTKVIKKQFGNNQNINKKGWLTVGFNGAQPSLAEGYISTGSGYHAANIFVALGLAPNTIFWTETKCECTNMKAWSGKNIDPDHAYKEMSNFMILNNKVKQYLPIEFIYFVIIMCSIFFGFGCGIYVCKKK